MLDIRTVALELALRRKGRQDEPLFERSIIVFPPPPSASSPAASSSSRPGPDTSDLTPASSRPAFSSSLQRFAIAVPSTLPQCLHQPGLSLAYTLSAHLTLSHPLSPLASDRSSAPSEVVTERMEIHLCPSGRPSSQAAPLIRAVPAPGRTPTPVLVGFPKTRCRKSEPIRLWVEIPIPEQQALERGVSLRNVRAELWRVVTVTSAGAASSSAGTSTTGTASSDKVPSCSAALPPSKVAQASSGLTDGSGSISTLLTTTGSSCRFSPLSPVRLRLSVHAPLSPSSAYQLTCGHLSQHVAAIGGERVDVRFWVKVMVGFIGAEVEEVDCEQEVVVLGDLDDAGHEPLAASAPVVPQEEDANAAPASTAIDPTRSFSKEKPYEGETFRQPDDVGPSSSASVPHTSPPGFVEALPTFSSHPSSGSTQHSLPHDPPPFSDFPSSNPPLSAADLPHASSSSRHRPPPFTPVATILHDPSPPPPTFLESVPQTDLSASLAPLGAVAELDTSSFVPFLNLPPQVAPPTSPSADPANLPADWLEVDGYETFSLPAPSVSIGLEAEGSVDPPQEGEGAGVDRSRLERIYDSISPSALRSSSPGASSAAAAVSHMGGVAMTREGSRVDDPNDLPPTFRDLALSPAAPSDDPPHFHQLAVERSTAGVDDLPPHPSEVRSEARRLARQQGAEVVPPPYAGDGLRPGLGVTRSLEADEGGEQPPRYS